MAMMEICSDPEDRQTSTMHEASLLALKVRKVGHSANLRFGNPNPSSDCDGGGAKALLLGGKGFSLAAKGTFVPSAHGTNEGPKETETLALERLPNKGKLTAAAPDN
ncbi:unnamed protein product [Sphagnum troendelagicum]|uniref:Uncharacterized protein n=1 Tax=Sphagnum troendelagicum TaxID=128251 RepID=A0ABP0TK83_9BRYO